MKIKEEIVWVWHLSRGYRWQIVLNAALGCCGVGLSLLFIFLSKQLIDTAVAKELHSITTPAATIVAVIVVHQACSVLRTIVESRCSTRMVNDLRERLFYRVMLSRWSGKEQFHTGDITTRLEGDVKRVCETICTKIPLMAITAMGLVSSFIFLLTLDKRLAWVLLLIMPVSLILSKSYVKRVRRLTHAIREIDSSMQSHIQEQVLHRSVINSLGQSRESILSLNSLSTKLFQRTMDRTHFTLFSRAVVGFGFSAGYITAFMWGVMGINDGTITFGVMTAFLQLVARVQSPIVDLSSYVSTIAQTTSSIDRVGEIDGMEIEEEGEDLLLGESVGVNVAGVTFRYEERAILADFSYDFLPNKLHIIVGETGSGKSTLLKLLLGFITPESGSVELYNDTESAAASSLTRANFVYVPQGNTLISGTIRENILLGDPTASEERIAEVLHTAVAEFVYSLPEGLDTMCGERGAGLSEGEAQRIAIARGLLRRGAVILLDEPSSALDRETEKKLIERLRIAAKSRTLIMVTHRSVTSEGEGEIVKLKREK